MDRHGIPASITLAQGILETGSGRSKLARYHNNHFGIKCGGSWSGKRTYAKDDSYNDCFRSYRSWEQSYEDHSVFLKQRRYHRLFGLRPTNYKAWAKGLQKAGYATSRTYARGLINLIERFELYEFDRGDYPSWFLVSKRKKPAKRRHKARTHRIPQIYVSGGLRYIIAQEGDSFTSIAKELKLSPARLASYNELKVRAKLKTGAIIYLEEKRELASPDYFSHIVEEGESMYSIAQRYGMLLESLYKLNDRSPDYVPSVGDKLRLR